jgi:hypothetical protein
LYFRAGGNINDTWASDICKIAIKPIIQ